MGVLASNAHGLDQFESALREGRSGVRSVPRMKELNFACQVGGVIEGLEELKQKYFAPDLLVSMKAQVIPYGCIAALDAWKDAKLPIPAPEEDRVDWETGAILGTGCGGLDLVGKLNQDVLAGKTRRLGSTYTEQVMVSGVSARLSGLLGLGGRVTTNSSACSTGTEAIVEAFYTIRDGRAKRMIAGGVENSDDLGWAMFDAMRVLVANRNHEPEKASRPMSASAAGFVPGSGAGALVLESLESARDRGAHIYAEVLSGFVNCGGHRMGGSMTAPNPAGVQRCVREAIRLAGIRSEEIDAINGHLTGTMADPLEIANWHEALGLPIEKFPMINSTKSIIGHGLGAAGGIESVASILQLTRGFMHGSLNCEDLHPKIEPYAKSIPQKTIPSDMRIIAKASFGFGDVNGCVIYRKWDERSV